MQQAIRPSTLIDAIGDEVWNELRAHMQRRAFAPGETLVEQGTLEPDFHIIIEGTAGVEASGPQGQRRSLGTLGPGESVGDMALLTGDPASADVIARSPLVSFSLAPGRLAELEHVRHRVIEALALLLAARLRTANQRLLAQHAAIRHAIYATNEALPALRRLPAEIARTVDARVLVLTMGEPAVPFAPSPMVERRSVDADDRGAIARMLDHVSLEYDQILLFAPPSFDAHELDCGTSADVVLERDTASPAHAGALRIVVGERQWVQGQLRALSERLQRPIAGVIPPDGGSPGHRDPTAKLARLLTGKRLGVALGAGAAKGLAHLGVLRAIEDMQIDVDMISGCSIGSAIAAGYAAGYNMAELPDVVARVAARALRPTLPLHSFLSNRGIREELERLGQGRRFEDLDLPLAIPAVDIFRRCEVTFTSGLVWPRILASMAIPGIYPPLRAGDSYLVDGSVLNPVPVRQCRDMGAGVVIGVRLTGSRTSPRDHLDFEPSRPLAADTVTRCFEIMHNRLSELSRGDADATIEVLLEKGGLRDFDRAGEYAEIGYAAAMAARPTLAEVIPYVQAAA